MTKWTRGRYLNPKSTQQQQSPPANELLADFLHELNLARRSLTLYPAEHPQVKAICGKTLDKLQKLCHDRQEIHLGIAPESLFFDQHWLDPENRNFKAFASFFYQLGIAAVSFRQNLSARELITFCQLLHYERQAIDAQGGLEELLAQQQIDQISVIPIDYSAFQQKEIDPFSSEAAPEVKDLWKDFLHALLENILDLSVNGLRVSPATVAELMNEKLDSCDDQFSTAAVTDFLAQLLTRTAGQPEESMAELAELLGNLAPKLRRTVLHSSLQLFEHEPGTVATLLKQLSPELLQELLTPQLQQQLQRSPRLLELVRQLAILPKHELSSTTSPQGKMAEETMRARLDVLFSEEQHERYLPGTYQAALGGIFGPDQESILDQEERELLKASVEEQSIEEQCCKIIFELLEEPEKIDDENSIQQNLIDLSNFFLDTGNFAMLQEIYRNWGNFLASGRSAGDIFSDRVLASQTQRSFIAEVLNGVDIWGESQAAAIRDYIAAVGESYVEPVIEQLADAQQYKRRRYWMEVLAAIGADASQQLIASLADKRWYLTRNLLTVLGKTLTPATLKAIQQLVDHPHPKVRQEVMRVLFQCNPATANRMLLKELAASPRESQLAAIQLAALSRDPEVLNFLHQQLFTATESDAELKFKQQVLQTLAKIGSRETIPLLQHLLQRRTLFAAKQQKQYQKEIIRSLLNYPLEIATAALREIASSRQKQHAKQAAECLHELPGGTA